MDSAEKIILPNNPPFFHKEGNEKLVVFIHGLTGEHTETWTWEKSEPPFFWPEELFNDTEFAGFDVLSFGYKSDCGIAYNIIQLAQSLETTINELMGKVSYQSISFIGHSLGGLVTRQFLLDHHKELNVDSVVLLGTPNVGTKSILAKLGKTFCDNPQIKELSDGDVID